MKKPDPFNCRCALLLGSAFQLAIPMAVYAIDSTILPTDVVPIPSKTPSMEVPNPFQLRLWQSLPAKAYFNSSVEGTFRIETNPFQNPTKRTTLHKQLPVGSMLQAFLPPNSALAGSTNVISNQQLLAINKEIAHASSFNNVFRINPNVTAGWSLTPKAQIFGTYFLLRDCLLRSSSLNSTTQAVGLGAQYTFDVGKKLSIQPQITVRELYQTEEPNVLDYLPAVTFQYQVTPNLTVYENSLLQIRFKHFVAGPMRELDPFHTIGLFYNRRRWSFSASGTFVQNFRQQFGRNALIPVNNDSIILDFEIDRQLSPAIPGLQAIIRAEPVYNFASNNTSGLSGMDFRLYYGFRFSAAKPALADNINQLRNRYTQDAPSARDIENLQ